MATSLTALNMLTLLRASATCGCSNADRHNDSHACTLAGHNDDPTLPAKRGNRNGFDHAVVNHPSVRQGTVKHPSVTLAAANNSAVLPLNETNLAAHNNLMVAAADGRTPLQQWLASTDDTLAQGREIVGWVDLIGRDNLAADIDSMVSSKTRSD
ncbi:hypothetical protein LTR85_005069 [Meristemomyces frigidus]|nr:hypothetical protein LTR85_005069 [Meristemomyces frigidus]